MPSDVKTQTGAERTIAGKYRLGDVLGEGASGVVHRAFHLGLEKTFALKLLRASPDSDQASLRRFRREATALGGLEHPGIVDVTDFGIDEASGQAYLVMEHLGGVTLAEHIRARGPLPPAQALSLLEAIADAVAHAHERGILHRDLKPANVLLEDPFSWPPRLSVVDFGLAVSAPSHFPDAGITQGVAPLGTPLYAAPEVIRGEDADVKSDVYSFGVIAYELLAGRPPFEGSPLEVLEAHLERAPPDPRDVRPGLPASVAATLLTPLVKDPACRPASTREVVQGLRRATHQDAVRTWWRSEAPRRLALSVPIAALSLLLTLPFGALPLSRAWDRWARDLRFAFVPPSLPDERLLLMSFDGTANGGGVHPGSLADRADEFADRLERVFASGAHGIAIDLLPPAKWSHSERFSRFVLGHEGRLALAAVSTSTGEVIGPECIAGLTASALGPDRASSLFAFVNLDEDDDGVTRRAHVLYHDRDGRSRATWAGLAAQTVDPSVTRRMSRDGESFWIDHSMDWRRVWRIAWTDVDRALSHTPEIFDGRLVLVGGDFSSTGDDYHRVPNRVGSTEPVSGLILQARIVNTILRGFPMRDVSRGLGAVLTLSLSLLVVAAILCLPRWRMPLLVVAATGAAYLIAVLWSFRVHQVFLPVAEPMWAGAAGLSAAIAIRRRLPCFPRWAEGPWHPGRP